VGARFSAPVQTGPGSHPAFCARCPVSFPGAKRPRRGFPLTASWILKKILSVHPEFQRQALQETLRGPYCFPPRLTGEVHHDCLRNVPPDMPKGVALAFIGGSCMMVLQHILFLQFDSSQTACFREHRTGRCGAHHHNNICSLPFVL
jgi:hypothetical protein